MRKYLLVVLLSLFSTGAFASARCDKQPNVDKIHDCYYKEAKIRKLSLDEYLEMVTNSPEVPAEVKSQVVFEYNFVMSQLQDTCIGEGKGNMKCISDSFMLQINSIYDLTNKYTVPRYQQGKLK